MVSSGEVLLVGVRSAESGWVAGGPLEGLVSSWHKCAGPIRAQNRSFGAIVLPFGTNVRDSFGANVTAKLGKNRLCG